MASLRVSMIGCAHGSKSILGRRLIKWSQRCARCMGLMCYAQPSGAASPSRSVAQSKEDQERPRWGVSPTSDLRASEQKRPDVAQDRAIWVKRRQTFVSDWKAFFEALDNLETNSNRHPEAGEKFKVYVELLARTGLRMTEAAYLEWADVDLKAKTLTIIAERSKNGEAITLPLSEQTTRLLEAQNERTGDETYVWGTSPYGDPRKTLTTFREALGWPIGFHDLRRSFSTVATRLDVQQTKLKRLMNHSTANDVTAGYQILIDPEMMREAVQAVSAYIDQQRVV